MNRATKLLGIINLDEDSRSLSPLTNVRPLASIPFAGRYRIIDFVLSNMVNSGISTVGIYVKDRERSLMDHLRSGKPWDLAGMSGGLFIFSPYSTPGKINDLKGDIMTIYNNRDFIKKSPEKYVLVSGSNMVTSIDYDAVLKEHIEKNNDITVIYKEIDNVNHYFDNAFTINDDKDGKIKSFGVKIVKNKDKDKTKDEKSSESAKISMNMYIMSKKLFIELVDDAVMQDQNAYLREVLQDASKKYNMYGYKFEGYLGYINSVNNYFETSMGLLKEEEQLALFHADSKIITKVKNESPAYYSKKSDTQNSLIANGCSIEGEVKNSILFRRVIVEKGAKIENSIIMQNSIIRKDSKITNAIIDKNVEVTAGTEIKGSKKQPLVIEKGSLV